MDIMRSVLMNLTELNNMLKLLLNFYIFNIIENNFPVDYGKCACFMFQFRIANVVSKNIRGSNA